MMNPRPDDTGRDTDRGFSLVELLVVIGIIAIMAAVSLPAIARYIRTYRIQGAARQVAGEMQAARNKAIAKNVNLGVVFVVISPTTYAYAVEDDQTGTGAGRTSARQTVATVLADVAQAGPLRTLPQGVTFTLTCPPGTNLTGAVADSGMRFNRMGAWCDPNGTAEPCPALGTGSALVNNIPALGSVVCVTETNTGAGRAITVQPGGRVLPVN